MSEHKTLDSLDLRDAIEIVCAHIHSTHIEGARERELADEFLELTMDGCYIPQVAHIHHNYMPDGPGWTGTTAICQWGASPDCVSILGRESLDKSFTARVFVSDAGLHRPNEF